MANSNLFSVNGKSDQVLLVSGQSIVGNGTGLFLFDEEGIQKIDGLPTAAVYPMGEKYLGRLLCSDAPPNSPAELLIYDEAGIERYARVSHLADAHDMFWDGESIVCIATGNNNLAIGNSITQVSRHYVDGKRLQDGMLNRVQAVLRAYDPCLSCSTHAVGEYAVDIRLIGADGAELDAVRN